MTIIDLLEMIQIDNDGSDCSLPGLGQHSLCLSIKAASIEQAGEMGSFRGLDVIVDCRLNYHKQDDMTCRDQQDACACLGIERIGAGHQQDNGTIHIPPSPRLHLRATKL